MLISCQETRPGVPVISIGLRSTIEKTQNIIQLYVHYLIAIQASNEEIPNSPASYIWPVATASKGLLHWLFDPELGPTFKSWLAAIALGLGMGLMVSDPGSGTTLFDGPGIGNPGRQFRYKPKVRLCTQNSFSSPNSEVECIKYNLLDFCNYLLVAANFPLENDRILLWWVSFVTTL